MKITVLSPHQLFPLLISTWQILNSRRIILNKSFLNSILIKLMVMIWSVFTCWKWIEPFFKIFEHVEYSGWRKKGNIVPIFKKRDKQNIKNYRPVSLLPICGKIFECIICDNMLKYFLDSNLISPKQSGSRPGDSCINQLLSLKIFLLLLIMA